MQLQTRLFSAVAFGPAAGRIFREAHARDCRNARIVLDMSGSQAAERRVRGLDDSAAEAFFAAVEDDRLPGRDGALRGIELDFAAFAADAHATVLVSLAIARFCAAVEFRCRCDW